MILRLLLLLLLPATLLADATPIRFDRYHSYTELTAALQRWSAAHPRHARLRSIGKSLQGRELWLLTLTDHAAGDDRRKTGIYVDGGHHGNEIASSEAALHLAGHLLSGRDHPALAYLLRSHVFYIVPRVNPDAGELALSGIQVRGNLRPVDDDRDGVADEDGPEDLDGDGMITQMRVANPRGRWVELPGTRYMVRAGWGSRGQRYDLYSEGIDNDGDGRINEDPPGGIDLNRNYPPVAGPGRAPTEPESRAVLALLEGQRNIATVQSLHTYGGILFRPYGALPDSDLRPGDLQVFDELAGAYTRRTGNVAYGRPYGPGRRIHGALLDHCYGRLGMFSLTAELWRPPGPDTRRRGSPGGGLESIHGKQADAAWRRFNDGELGGRGTLPWKPFRHPTLGQVEIGGWHPFVRRNPPASHLEGVCRRITLFVLDQARMAPRLVIRRAVLEGGQLAVELFNSGRMPTFSEQAQHTGRYARDMLGVRLPEGLRLAGGADRAARKFGPLGGQQSVTLRFDLSGAGRPGGTIDLVAVSEKGGVARLSHTLR